MDLFTLFMAVQAVLVIVFVRSRYVHDRSRLFRLHWTPFQLDSIPIFSRSKTRCSWAITFFMAVQVVLLIDRVRSCYVKWPFKVVPPTLDPVPGVPVHLDGVSGPNPGVQGLKMFMFMGVHVH